MDKQSTLLSDVELLSLFEKRKEEAILETDRKYRPYLMTVAERLLSDRFAAEECLQDAYLKAWNAIPPAHPDHLSIYLAKIVHNTALDQIESAGRLKRIPGQALSPLDQIEESFCDRFTLEDEITSRMISRLISDYLADQSDMKLYIFVSRYYYGMSIEEISGKVGLSESSVSKKLTAMRRELKKKLIREGIFPEKGHQDETEC